MIHTRYADIEPYVTKDGSLIRELMHPAAHGNRQQSLAEATVPVGAATRPHQHRTSEELYYVLAGAGRMTLAGESFPVTAGDTICIRPGQVHCIENTGSIPLRLLCACAPPYAHADTLVVDDETGHG